MDGGRRHTVRGNYRVTTLNVTRIWIELAVWAAMVSKAQFSLSGSRLMASPGTRFDMKLFIEKIYSKVSPLRLWRETGTRPRKKDSEGTSREKRGDVDDAALRRTAADLAQASDSALAALESAARPLSSFFFFLLLQLTVADPFVFALTVTTTIADTAAAT